MVAKGGHAQARRPFCVGGNPVCTVSQNVTRRRGVVAPLLRSFLFRPPRASGEGSAHQLPLLHKVREPVHPRAVDRMVQFVENLCDLGLAEEHQLSKMTVSWSSSTDLTAT